MQSSTDRYRAIPQGQRRTRGKFRANAVQPRTSARVPSLLDPRLPAGVCVSYRIEDGAAVDAKVFRAPAQERAPRKVRQAAPSKRHEVEAARLRYVPPTNETAKISHGHNFNA